MAKIAGIKVIIKTSNIPNAGMDSGAVYLGICGREFHLDTAANNLQPGKSDTFILGTVGGLSSNVCNPDLNDPGNPSLDTSWLYDENGTTLSPFPYLRMEGGDHWNIASVCIIINAINAKHGTNYARSFITSTNHAGLWLGGNAGKICYIPPERWGEHACE